MFRGTAMPGNSTRCMMSLRGGYLWVTAQWKVSWENLKIPAVDSGGCVRRCEPFQPSTCIIFKAFPKGAWVQLRGPCICTGYRPPQGSLILPCSSSQKGQSMIRLNWDSILLWLCKTQTHVKGTSYIIPPRAQMWPYSVQTVFLSFNWVLTWLLNAI